ncbi:sulfotransferase [Synechococcus sp. M16CYN]|uniref:sulfotransferase n=1 Tax=Synechococcus sp. M16CYN TaxID=3103139 RepID=UPI00324CC2FE
MSKAISIRKPVSVNAPDIKATRRIYVVGFNRCGTRSLATAFERAGIGCVHWDRNQLMLATLSDLRRHGRINLPAHYPRSNAFLDFIHVPEHGETGDHVLSEGTLLHRQLIDSDPDAYFILNTRPVEAWLQSRCRHLNGSFLETYRHHLSRLHGYELKVDDVLLEWRRMWHQAHAEILQCFQQQSQLRSLVYDITHTPYNILKQFLAPDYNLVGEQLPRSGQG